MKRLMSITITLLFVFTLVFTAHAAETQAQPNMDDPGDYHMHDPWDDDDDDDDHHMPGPWDNRHHNGNFKIADLTGDDVPEIIILKDETLTVSDNEGDVLFTKTVEGIDD